MAKKLAKTKSKSPKVTVSNENIKERVSRSNFELHASPWLCVPTTGSTDHGHDYTVELVSKSSLNDYTPDGRFFLLQLRSQGKLEQKNGFIVPHPVATKHIKQWYRSSSQIPFIFAVNDLSNNTFYYQWIDDIFISELEKTTPFWSTQGKITLKIPVKNLWLKGENDQIRDYVYNHNYKSLIHLEPGLFFKLKNEITEAIGFYEKLILASPFDSVKRDVFKLTNDLENAAYRVAISGLSRVGKSSLVNKLLNRPGISPTDVWQTTGVPIIIQPSKEERVQINFHNKASESYPYSSAVIKQYATREFNEENHKKVRDVSVFISSSQLERGVMFYDIPGLDDPNDDIMEFAYHTAECANVVLYLIDGSTARASSFVFKNDYKKDIENFSQTSKEKIFLVVTKVDELSFDRLKDLKKEIERNLVKYNLKQKISSKIYYLSIEPTPINAENISAIQSEINSLKELDSDLWSFMLKENKVGLVKLFTLLKDLHESKKQLVEIIRSRALDAKDKKRLISTINDVKQRIPGLEKHIYQQKNLIAASVSKNLALRMNNIVEHLKNELLALKEMPSDVSIKNYLIKSAYNAVGKTQDDMGLQLNQLREYIDNWVKENLGPIQGIINIENKNIDDPLKNINDITLPSMDFSSMWGKGILLALAGIVITSIPGLGFVIGAGSIFLDLIFGNEDRHANRVRKTIQKINQVYSKGFADAEFQFNNIIDEQLRDLVEYINRKLKLYFSDIEHQINNYKLSPNFDYLSFERQIEVEIPNLQKRIDVIWDELQKHLAAAKLLS